MKINCFIAAWNSYLEGESKWMACTKSQWSKLKRPPSYIRILGALIVWTASFFWLIGHFLIFGTWPHWVYCNSLGDDCMEYVPLEKKSKHFIPPILFVGERRKTKGRRAEDYKE